MGMFSKSKNNSHSDNTPVGNHSANSEGFKMTPAGESSSFSAPHALTAEEVIRDGKSHKTKSINMSGGASPLEALRQKSLRNSENVHKSALSHGVENSSAVTAVPRNEQIPSKNAKANDDGQTLLDKCLPFITDNGGTLSEEKPAYTLDSVESILNSARNETDELLARLSKMGTVTVDNLNRAEPKNEPIPESEEVPEKPIYAVKEIPMLDPSELNNTRIMPTISDIDNAGRVFDTKTDIPTDFTDISSGTKIIDLSNEIFEEDNITDSKIPELDDENEDLELEPGIEYSCYEDAKLVGSRLIKNRNGSRAKLIFTLLFTGLLACAEIPFIFFALSRNAQFFSVIATAVFALICLINSDMFVKWGTLFSRHINPEATTGLVAAASLIYAVYSVLTNTNPYELLLFSSIIVSFKAIASYMKASYILGNFRIIATKNDKYAIKLIDDRHITFAMAKSSISGDVLVGAPNKTAHVDDFIKHTHISPALKGGLRQYTAVAVAAAVIMAIVTAVYGNGLSTFLSSLAINFGLVFSPTVLFTDILPLYRAAKRLNKKGAMISGVRTAEKIEMANAVTLSSSDLFPAGTITLFNMKILDSNRIDDTILDAAALTLQMNSPLYPIFADIAKTGDRKLPDADTVKYEERLGISGWVGDRRIFIGNRTLLEAHGIKVPPVSVDRKILQNGYFPVYLACNSSPCALLIVKYSVEPNLAYEMQKLCNSGVTLLIDSCDPNLVSDMICDYFALPEDSVRVMGSSGVQLYKNTTEREECISSGAAVRDSAEGYVSIFNSAAKIKKSVSVLSILHVILAFCMCAANIYSTVINQSNSINSGLAFAAIGVSLVIYLVAYFFNRP